MPATIQTIQKPTRARALDTSTSYQNISANYIINGTFAADSDWSEDTGVAITGGCLLYTSPSPRDRQKSRMPSSA